MTPKKNYRVLVALSVSGASGSNPVPSSQEQLRTGRLRIPFETPGTGCRARPVAGIGKMLEMSFTMEYSVRTAREAVSTLLKLDTRSPPVYQGQHDPRVLYQALNALA